MAYRKFSATLLFDGFRMRDDRPVLITNEDGTITDLVPPTEAGPDVLHLDGILSPGFVNCHCHLELSHMKGHIPERTGLIGFVGEIMRSRHFDVEEILSAIASGEEEMLDSGIVAVGDICNNALTAGTKAGKRLLYHNFIEVAGFVPSSAAERFQHAETVYNQLRTASGTASISPHAPYSVSDPLWEKIIHFPGNQLLSVHNQETQAENELFLRKTGEFISFYQRMNIDIDGFQATGKSSLKSILPRLLPSQSIILVHNVFTSQEDLLFTQQSGRAACTWCLCPNANLYISGRLPDIELLAGNNCAIVLGTDSLASNHQLSILAEINTIRRHYPSVSLTTLFGWGTLNGAKALNMEKNLGSFEPGKKPGIVLSANDLSACERIL